MSSLYENANTNTNTNTDKRVVLLPKKLNQKNKNKKVNDSITNITFRKQDAVEEQIYAEVYKSVCENIKNEVIDRNDQITFWKKYGLSEADYDAQLENDSNLRLIEKYEREMKEVPEELLEATKAYEEKINQTLLEDPNNRWWNDEKDWIDEEDETSDHNEEAIQKDIDALQIELQNKNDVDDYKKYFKILEEMWTYYYSSLEIEPYEYDIYGKIIDKIRKNDLDFSEHDKNNVLKLIKTLQFECDEYEIKILEKIEQIIGVC